MKAFLQGIGHLLNRSLAKMPVMTEFTAKIAARGPKSKGYLFQEVYGGPALLQ